MKLNGYVKWRIVLRECLNGSVSMGTKTSIQKMYFFVEIMCKQPIKSWANR